MTLCCPCSTADECHFNKWPNVQQLNYQVLMATQESLFTMPIKYCAMTIANALSVMNTFL